MTLEAAIAGAWEDLLGRGRAECLVCGDELRAAGGRGAGGECDRCGAALT